VINRVEGLKNVLFIGVFDRGDEENKLPTEKNVLK